MRSRYSRWDGTQDPLGPDIGAADVLDQMSEDLLSGAGAETALQRLLRRGMRGRFSGLDSLRARLRDQRRREQQNLDLEGPLEEIRERLESLLEREKTTLSFQVEDDARMRESFLDSLPDDVAGKLQELRDYRFVDKQARQEFDELMDFLRQQVLGSYFKNLSEGLQNMSPEELQRFRDMIAELNQMIEARDRGEPVDFDGFMERYGDFFPENPRNLDELLEGLARRMSAMSRLLSSLSPDQRAELQALAQQVMGDLDLQFEADRLMNNLAGMFPQMPWDDPALAGGEDAQPLSPTIDAFETLKRDREGVHLAKQIGGVAEPTGSTRPWHFGDSGQIAVQRTVFNAVVRDGVSEAPKLRPDDFELVDAETRTEAATALLLDLSFSMPLRGHFVHAKKMALALHALIEGRYPHVKLYLIGFSDYARRIKPEDLAWTGWERVYGTNMQHAFNLAGRLLADHPRATKQVIMVTDGEPTAHLEGEEVFFSWPPVPETIRLTLQEAMRLSKSGVTINVFMLEDSPGLARFMERLARLTNGRVFLMADEALGEFVVRDYVARRSA